MSYLCWLFSGTVRSLGSFQISLEPCDAGLYSQVSNIDLPIGLMTFRSGGRIINEPSITVAATHTYMRF